MELGSASMRCYSPTISKIDNRGERTTASQPPLSQQFFQFAHATSVWIGNSVAFLLAVAVIIV
jgi:hypothetical protein